MNKPVNCGCGGKAKVIMLIPEVYAVECSKCWIRTGSPAKTEAEAVAAWNRAMGERTANVIKHHYDFNPYKDNFFHGLGGTELLCSHCKKKVLDGDDYCSHCGAKLEWNE